MNESDNGPGCVGGAFLLLLITVITVVIVFEDFRITRLESLHQLKPPKLIDIFK